MPQFKLLLTGQSGLFETYSMSVVGGEGVAVRKVVRGQCCRNPVTIVTKPRETSRGQKRLQCYWCAVSTSTGWAWLHFFAVFLLWGAAAGCRLAQLPLGLKCTRLGSMKSMPTPSTTQNPSSGRSRADQISNNVFSSSSIVGLFTAGLGQKTARFESTGGETGSSERPLECLC